MFACDRSRNDPLRKIKRICWGWAFLQIVALAFTNASTATILNGGANVVPELVDSSKTTLASLSWAETVVSEIPKGGGIGGKDSQGDEKGKEKWMKRPWSSLLSAFELN